MKHRIQCLCFLLIMLGLLSGCMRTADELYRLPKRSDDYYNLQSSIDNAMSGLSYCAPLTGENQQTVQMADLDGDGDSEYLLFAKGTDEKPLRILVFRKIDDTYVNTDTVSCSGMAFDQVEYVDMDGIGGVEIVVGRQLNDQVIRSVSVYTFKEDQLVQLVSANYTKFLTVDLDGDKLWELFLLRPGQTDTDNGVAELYSAKSGTMERYNEVGMSQPADKLKRIIIGKLDGGKPAVYVASAAGDTALVTDVYSLVDNKLNNIAFSNLSGTDVRTLRNFYIYADDIDNDTIVELPSLITMKPRDEKMPIDTHLLIRWYAMRPDGEEVNKMYTYHNFVGGWYLQLESNWVPRVVVYDTGHQFEFYLWDEFYKPTDKIMTIYELTAQNREEQAMQDSRFVLLKTDSTVYAAQLEATAESLGLSQERVTQSFQLIQQDWKTGET